MLRDRLLVAMKASLAEATAMERDGENQAWEQARDMARALGAASDAAGAESDGQ